MENRNLAYDLSFYEGEQVVQKQRNYKRKAEVINAKSKFGYGKVILNVVSMAVIISLVIAVITSNAQLTTYTTQIQQTNDNITLLQSEYDYLNITLESRFTLEQVEEYARNTLGYDKLENHQITYINLASENEIESVSQSFTDKLSDIVQPILSYLQP